MEICHDTHWRFQQATLIKFSKQKLPPPTRTRKSALAPPSCRGRPAAAGAEAASSAFIFLAVSAGLLITLFAGCEWHAIRYYVWNPPNAHHGRHHATVLTILHTGGVFQCGWPMQHDACITLGGWCVQQLASAWRAWANATATRCQRVSEKVLCRRPRATTEFPKRQSERRNAPPQPRKG
jgi:hypothetical protein